MNVAHVDFETFSKINLKNVGVYRYAEHPSTEIQVIGYAMNDDKPKLWIPLDPPGPTKEKIFMAVGVPIHWGLECPQELIDADQYRAHNSQFERVLANSHAGKAINFPHTEIEDWVCTAAKAAVHNLPRALEYVCQALDTEHQKDTTNKNAMMKVAKPRKPSKKDSRTRWSYDNALDSYIKMYRYNVDDVLAERAVDYALDDLTPGETYLFELDQKINGRGVTVDTESIRNAMYLIADYKSRIAQKCIEITGVKPTQREKLVDWLRDNDCEIPDLQAPTIRDHLKAETNVTIRRVLRIRQSHEMKAPAKYSKMLDAMNLDFKLRGMLLYHGAGTGRWSGLLVQLQNLFRGVLSDPNNAISLYEELDLDFLMMLYDEDPMQIFASTIRGMLIASPGKILRCADYSAIEGVMTAWLAGQEDKLEIFRTHRKVYEATAAKIFNLYDGDPTLEQLLKLKKEFPDERFAGKTSELALGFQGAVDALNRMARKEGKEFKTEFALEIVRGWRKTNDKIQTLWRNLENYAYSAVANPGNIYRTNKIMFKVEGDFLYMRLPSGRRLAYYKPLIVDGKYGEQVSYMGVDTISRQYKRVTTYGGRLTENAASGTARDYMAHGMVNLDKAGYNIILTVHDEIVNDDDPTFGSLEEMCQIMCDSPDWAEDCPITADGWEGHRYKKDM